mmetsp:Transcript_12712/g.31645  ORF Transcript_12712/g.31645 Transcript_12712/m.31645 type:complete len:367 (+) Transcript_12712:197-1297(+)
MTAYLPLRLADLQLGAELFVEPEHQLAAAAKGRRRREDAALALLLEKLHPRLHQHLGRVQVARVAREVVLGPERRLLAAGRVDHLADGVQVEVVALHGRAARPLAGAGQEALEDARHHHGRGDQRAVRLLARPLRHGGVAAQQGVAEDQVGAVPEQRVGASHAVGHHGAHDPRPAVLAVLAHPHVLLGVCDLGERGRLAAVARAQQRVEVGLGGAPLLAKLVDGRGECAAARAEGVAKLAVRLRLDERRALALRVLVHLEDGEVPGDAVVAAVDHDAGARLLRRRVVLRNHRPKEVGLSRDVCVVHALLGAQLDQRLSVFLKRAGGGDHHLRLLHHRPQPRLLLSRRADQVGNLYGRLLTLAQLCA